MLTRHAHNRRSRNRLLRGRSARRGGGGAPLTLRQQIGQVLGVEPQVYADARDLDLDDGDPVTVFGDWTAIAGSPEYDADGWGGALPGVTTGGFVSALDASNYGSLTGHVWSVSLRTIEAANNRSIIGLSNNRDQAEQNKILGAISNDNIMYRTRLNSGSQDQDFGSALPEGVLLHIGVVYDGARATVRVLTSGGFSTLINDAPHALGETVVFDEAFLGGVMAGWNEPADLWALAQMTRVASPTVQQLDDVLNLHNQAYPVA